MNDWEKKDATKYEPGTIEEERLLNLLLHEVAEVRDDDRYMQAQFGAIISVVLALAVGMTTLFFNTCPPGNCPQGGKLIEIPIWIYIAAPLVPIGLLAYAILLATTSTLRSYYNRKIERRIHDLTGQRQKDDLPIPSWAHLQLFINGQAHASGLPFLNWCLVYITLAAMVVGSVIIAFTKIPDVRQGIFFLVVDLILLAIPLVAVAINATVGFQQWDKALHDLESRLERTDEDFPPRNPKERSLAWFLLLPRNQEELLKALFIPISFLFARFLASQLPPIPDIFWNFVAFFFIFEFLVYQARYLLNDVRDRRVDNRPGLSKRRFPSSSLVENGDVLKVAFGSFIARLIVSFLFVICLLPLNNWIWAWHLTFLILVFVIALPYEAIRSKCISAASTGRKALTRWTMLLIGVVGLGYGLRSVVGMWLAGIRDTIGLVLAAVGASLFGSAFVALTWALESTRPDDDELAKGKAHLLLFRNAVRQSAARLKVAARPSEKVLAGRQTLLAPWSTTTVLATGTLTAIPLYLMNDRLWFVTSRLCLFNRCANLNVSVLIAGGVLIVAVVSVVVRVTMSQLLTVLGLVPYVFLLYSTSVAMSQSIIATIISVLPLLVACGFRSMCFNDLPGVVDKIIDAIKLITSKFYLWFIKER